MRSGAPQPPSVEDAFLRLENLCQALPSNSLKNEFEEALSDLSRGLTARRVAETPPVGNVLASRVQALEEALRASEERGRQAAEAVQTREQLTSILEGLTGGFVALDRDWRFNYVTRRGAQHSGRSPEDLLGRNIWEVYPQMVGTRFHKELTRAAADRVQTEFEEYYPAFNAWYEIRIYPYRDGLTIYTHDITQRKRAEESLRETQEFVTRLLENAPCSIFVTSRDRRYRLVNRAWETALGVRREDAIGRSGRDCFPDAIAEPFDDSSRRVIDTGEALTLDQEIQLPSGQHFFHTVQFPLRDAAGRIDAVGGIAVDVTERRFAEEAQRESEERFRVMAEMVPDILFTARADGAWDYVNQRFFDFTGLGPAESLGFGWTAVLHPEEAGRTGHGKDLAAVAGEPGAEVRLRGADGQFRWFVLRSRAIGDFGGKITRWFGTITDIDDRKRAEQQVRDLNAELEQRVKKRTAQLQATNQQLASEIVLSRRTREALRVTQARLEFLLSVAPAVIYANKPTGDWAPTFISDNFRAVLGYDAADFTSHPSLWMDHIHPDDLAAATPDVADLLNQGELFQEYRFLHRDGTYRWLHNSVKLVRDAHGQPTEVVGCWIDVSDRKRDQERILQSERLAAIGEAMAGLCHESRNALQRSKACLAMLALDLQDRPEALDLIGRTKDAQDRLHFLYEQVRQYAAPVRLHKQVCDLSEVAREAWAQLALMRDGRTVRLREVGDELDRQCAADASTLEQVFRNLFENSLAACADPVEIELHWTTARLGDAAAVRVAVRDNGPGLTTEVKRRIFEAFFTTKTHGTGLGMAIAKRIVEAHGGRITVGNSGTAGAEFLITMPRGHQNLPPNAKKRESVQEFLD